MSKRRGQKNQKQRKQMKRPKNAGKIFAVNKDNSRKLVLCSSAVNKTAIRRETIDGAEHIIVGSYTLPDNVVMNGGLYPADEIEKSYMGLERTLAPIEHPKKDGNFVSANDPYSIHNFHAGAYNANVRREGNRIYVEKVINVQEAMKSDRGKRLLDRINEIETNDKARPIHTSTGLFLEVEKLDAVMTNDAGQKYSWIAKNMTFDHDAILLDTIGAATPEEGVGMAINAAGDKIEVERVEVIVKPVQKEEKQTSVSGIQEQLETLIKPMISHEWLITVDMVEDQYIFETDKGYHQVQFRVSDGTAVIVGIPIRSERTVTYSPKVNEKEGDAMKELILAALAEAGITVNSDISDADLMAEYQKLLANQSQGDDESGAASDDVATVVANAVSAALEPVTSELASLKSEIQANADNEKQQYVDLVANSEKYPAIDAETAKLLPLEKLKEMAGNCGAGYGLPLHGNQGSGDSSEFEESEMPK